MTQPDLFDRQSIAQKFTRTGSSIVPPTPDELARQRRDSGIQRAADHAQKIDREWLDKAVAFVRQFARYTPHFMTEDARDAAIGFVAQPPDKRVWGAVMRRAARDGFIKADGYAPANSSNKSPKCRWKSLLIG